MADKQPTAVIGAGAWGTALAWSVAQNGRPVTIWALEREVVESINTTHENRSFLPGLILPDNLRATDDMEEAVKECRVVIFVAPSQFMRKTLEKLKNVIPQNAIVVSATKGIENNTLALPAQMIADTMPADIADRACFLSGPTFAKELIKKHPTAGIVASKDPSAAKLAQETLSAPWLRLYVSYDVVGAELGGALKNVIAIAAGISDGLGLGHNSRVALITRGIVEMTRLGLALGAEERTFSGLSGIGDLVLTCSGDLSRNRSVGIRIGKGEGLKEILDSMTAVAEGVATSVSVYNLARREGVDMPISNEVYKTLHEGKDPRQAVLDLMSRELKPEF
ncbi:Glycerol-3-phosphate dehydrogenase [NAD(P)+] [hydrothermal vent metagenome]|uniref:Glycerol-3-phosphate dehydrogenase [NAD(P)+] n=1 Tax=hydrothermal vent metagenome TaxID=652676 RepID=A0A3B1CB56_9ZZZZ